ncbi:hypothetical protein CVS40_3410 [Lucilia cuprina]|nr:hypothetical protein CVS40_3410 [Lucilia cuprina]KAI8126858.1 hypothetical protein CVS40_3410 [Lucilia cuprina]
MLTLLKQKVSSAFVSQKLLELDAHNEESKTFAVLWYLHYIFSPNQKVNTDPSGSKIRKKFSIADSQNSFAILADSSQELETKIKLLQLQNRCIQPKLLIVGQFPNIKSINIYLDNISFFCEITIREPFATSLSSLPTFPTNLCRMARVARWCSLR